MQYSFQSTEAPQKVNYEFPVSALRGEYFGGCVESSFFAEQVHILEQLIEVRPFLSFDELKHQTTPQEVALFQALRS